MRYELLWAFLITRKGRAHQCVVSNAREYGRGQAGPVWHPHPLRCPAQVAGSRPHCLPMFSPGLSSGHFVSKRFLRPSFLPCPHCPHPGHHKLPPGWQVFFCLPLWFLPVQSLCRSDAEGLPTRTWSIVSPLGAGES